MGALHLAAVKGHDEIAQEFLDSGIAPDMQDKNGTWNVLEQSIMTILGERNTLRGRTLAIPACSLK